MKHLNVVQLVEYRHASERTRRAMMFSACKVLSGSGGDDLLGDDGEISMALESFLPFLFYRMLFQIIERCNERVFVFIVITEEIM